MRRVVQTVISPLREHKRGQLLVASCLWFACRLLDTALFLRMDATRMQQLQSIFSAEGSALSVEHSDELVRETLASWGIKQLEPDDARSLWRAIQDER